MFPLLRTGCPSCNMITAITVATELQVNKGEVEWRGFKEKQGSSEGKDDKEEWRGGNKNV